MDIQAVRDLRAEKDFALFGVAATIKLPGQNTAVATSVVWLEPREYDQPHGEDLARVDPRRVAAIPRSEFPDFIRGTELVAPEEKGGDDRTWTITSLESEAEPDHYRVFVAPKAKW